jgi:MFS family permease
MPPISDKYGRRLFIYVGSAIQILVYLLILVTSSYQLYLGLIFLYGLTMSIRMFIVYPHLMECMPPSLAPQVSNYLFFIDGFVYILSPVILLIMNDTKWLLLVGMVMNVTSLIGLCIIQQDESVRWRLTKGRYEEANQETLKVARINRWAVADLEKVLAAIAKFEGQQKE